MSATILVLSESVPDELRYLFDRRFIEGIRKDYVACSDSTGCKKALDSCTTDLAYIVDADVRPAGSVGRQVLPSIKSLLVTCSGVFGGSREALTRHLSGATVAVRDLGQHATTAEGMERPETLFVRRTARSSEAAGTPCRVLIAILSCCKCEDRRSGIRDSWVRHLPDGVDYKFYVGEGDAPDGRRADMVLLDHPDDYQSVPGKQMKFYKWVLENCSFEWLFQCDDDTYIAPDRLLGYIDDQFDMIGLMFRRGYLHGGAGYFISRCLLQKMVADEGGLIPTGNGDIRFSSMAHRSGARMKHTRIGAINHHRSGSPVTRADIATTHYVSPDDMRKMHAQYVMRNPHVRQHVAVCVSCTGAYFALLKEFMRSMKQDFLPGLRKVVYVFTDAPCEAVADVSCGLNIRYVYTPKNQRVWFFMHKTVMLEPVADELAQYSVVALLDVTVRFRREVRWDDVHKPGSDVVFYGKDRAVPGLAERHNDTNRRRRSAAALPTGSVSFPGWPMDCVKFVDGSAIEKFIGVHSMLLSVDERGAAFPLYHAESYNVYYAMTEGRYQYMDTLYDIATMADKRSIGVPFHDGGMCGRQDTRVY